MNILIVHNHPVPVHGYGGVERIVWWLAKELVRLGHQVTFLVPSGSHCPFAAVVEYDPTKPLNDQIPGHIEFVHLCFPTEEKPGKPYLVMYQYNYFPYEKFDINTVFVSKNHAQRHQSETYVYNSLDIEEYGKPDFTSPREHLLFLGYAKRPEKNLKDCLKIARRTKNTLAVVGGKDKWYRRRPWASYKGFLGGEEKMKVLRRSKALLFPVLWHEPFGIALIEALYFGAPVVGSPFGSLAELIHDDVGCVSASISEMTQAVMEVEKFDKKKCHEYVCDQFTSRHMTQNYLKLYEKILSGEPLNKTAPVNNGNFSRDSLLELVP